MKNKEKFIGTGVAVITPFKKNKAVDFDALGRIINHLIEGKVEYLVIQGTTGESVTVDMDEKIEILSYVASINKGRLPIVFGIGGNNTQSIIKSFSKYKLDGVDAILSVCPYYNKPRQEGIYEHFKAIADASPKPVIVYNVPGRTVVNMEPETTLKLAENCPNIIAIKEATDSPDQIMKLIARKPKNFTVIGGDDALALPFISLGTSGVISVIANAFPKEFSEMVRLALKGNFAEARKIHYRFVNLMQGMLPMGNPGAIKAIMNILGFCNNELRLPLVPISKENYKILEKLVKDFMNE